VKKVIRNRPLTFAWKLRLLDARYQALKSWDQCVEDLRVMGVEVDIPYPFGEIPRRTREGRLDR
jgi:hypothetical protein